MVTHLVRREPLSILTEDFIPTLEEAERAHKLQQILTFCAKGIDELFEQAVRVLREFVDNPRLMRAAGWNSVDEMLLDPDVRGALKIAVTSYEQRRRLLRVAEVDRHVPSVGVLRVEHLTTITTTSRLRRLEKLVKEELPPDERPKYITNYIGSKQKLVDWIWKHTPEGVESVIDAFSGSAVVASFTAVTFPVSGA